MYAAAKNIAESFNINPVNIYKCKYYYVVHSQKGSFLLSAARPRKERLENIHFYKEQLSNSGFYAIDNYLLCNGKPYCEYDRTIYTMCKYYGNSELDILSNIQCAAALETIGSLGKAIKNIRESGVYAAEMGNPVINSYEKQINRLYKAKKRLSPQREFDILLLKYINPVIQRAENAIENLKKLNYGNEMTICHNSLKEGNIVYSRGKCWIIDWDNMKTSHYLEDCAFFIKRYIRKNAFITKDTKAQAMNINDLLSHYTKNFRLSCGDLDILIQLLNYPHRFISLIIEYCSKNRGFIPSGLKNKLNECMAEWEFLYNYVGSMQ